MKRWLEHPLVQTGAVFAASAVLLLAAFICPVGAYFTTNTNLEIRSGAEVVPRQYAVKLQERVEEEDPVFVKHVSILNDGSDNEVYVRVTAFAPSDADVLYRSGQTYGFPSGGWVEEDGWYMYELPVESGETSPELDIQIQMPTGEEEREFNVIVNCEASPACYDENGNPYADWSQELVVVEGD